MKHILSANMKIVYCIPSLHIAGGMERVLSIKANYLADFLNYDVTIILTDGKDDAPYFPLSSKIRIINLDLNFDRIYSLPLISRTLLYQKLQFKYRKRLSRLLYEIKPDITISMLRREINFINKIKDGSAKIGELHLDRENYRSMKDEDKRGFFKTLLSKIWMNKLINDLKKLDAFVVLTHEDKDKWTEIPGTRVIHNPLPFWTNEVTDCKAKQVIVVGRYTHQKGIDLAIKSWEKIAASHPDWILKIYGAGDRTTYQELVDQLGLNYSVYLESPTNRIERKYMESSIFVLSSRYEGFGMVIAEAMSCGLPVVSYACPCGPKDIITHGEDGYLVPPEDINELARYITQLINDENLRRQMGVNARKNVARMQIQHIGAQWDALFKEISQAKN